MPPRRAYALILSIFLLCCSFVPLYPCALASSPAAAEAEQITFIVYLQEQADLTPYTTRTPDPEPQTPNTEPRTPNASAVVEALQATAARTQLPLQAFLDKLKTAGQ
ncbi:MAG: hypothetical protein FJ026_15600, partial [Chloroflexi bacterium]|nr:hypothetical protein [Chloroflexota bacterium]